MTSAPISVKVTVNTGAATPKPVVLATAAPTGLQLLAATAHPTAVAVLHPQPHPHAAYGAVALVPVHTGQAPTGADHAVAYAAHIAAIEAQAAADKAAATAAAAAAAAKAASAKKKIVVYAPPLATHSANGVLVHHRTASAVSVHGLNPYQSSLSAAGVPVGQRHVSTVHVGHPAASPHAAPLHARSQSGHIPAGGGRGLARGHYY